LGEAVVKIRFTRFDKIYMSILKNLVNPVY
jgi:hypothetical protein